MTKMADIYETLSIIAQIAAYIIAIIIAIQIIRILLGGSWEIESVILALLVLNLTITFSIINKISRVEKIIHGHIEWHKGRDNK